MKEILILLITLMLFLISCDTTRTENETENVNSYDTPIADHAKTDTEILYSVNISEYEDELRKLFTSAGFIVPEIIIKSPDKAKVYVWADNYGNETSLTLEDAEKISYDFCLENFIPQEAIVMTDEEAYNRLDIGYGGGAEGIPLDEFNRLEAEGHPLATAITRLCERNFEKEYSVLLKDETLYITFCEGVSYNDLAEPLRYIINHYIDYIVITEQ